MTPRFLPGYQILNLEESSHFTEYRCNRASNEPSIIAGGDLLLGNHF